MGTYIIIVLAIYLLGYFIAAGIHDCIGCMYLGDEAALAVLLWPLLVVGIIAFLPVIILYGLGKWVGGIIKLVIS